MINITNRRKTTILISNLFAFIIALSGCNSQPNETMGTVLGGIGGGIIGNQVGGGTGQTVATIAGATIGAMAGNAVGQSMDRVDTLNMNNALQNQSDNKSTTWVNPKSNVRYTVTPTTSSNDGSNYCRDYKMNTIIDGRSETVTGRACRENGKWVKQ